MRGRSVGSRRAASLLAVVILGAVTGCGGSSSDTADSAGEPKSSKTAPPAQTAGEPTEHAPSNPESSPRPSREPGAAKVTGKTLSKKELERAALVEGDVAGFAVTPMAGAPPAGETADRAECSPLTALMNGAPEPVADAAVYRQIVGGKDEQMVVTEFLTAHKGQSAGQVLSRLDAAVVACADGFTADGGEDGPSVYSGVRRLAAPKAGDQALAYQLTGDYEGEDVPLVFQVVRTGATVATYYTANLVDAKTPEIPAAISAAQADKLASAPR
ncbi:hypothetical protein PUR57_37170 [Streptomyces sp. JV176]|uniref:hypothetical protein n=1 Tax=Streptomyces sp. JV176 TaxID=858630 RepID=UPI002E79F723|nr:hypothetical protein [Streptomyces sp. JV176]MEE1804246.1 hypothetical protein [Streptomyces sp. JV176]